MKLLICLSLIALAIGAPDVYWRPYDGSIPADAVLGASEGPYRSYVGRADVYRKGLYVGQLFGGVLSIDVPGWDKDDFFTQTEYIEILCSSHPENFEWVPATNRNMYTTTGVLVGGGYQYTISIDTTTLLTYELFIGRYNNTLNNEGYRIGKIDPYYKGQGPYIYFVSNDSVYTFFQFEVLTYKEPKLYEEDIAN